MSRFFLRQPLLLGRVQSSLPRSVGLLAVDEPLIRAMRSLPATAVQAAAKQEDALRAAFDRAPLVAVHLSHCKSAGESFLPLVYYERALEEFEPSSHVLVFSDDRKALGNLPLLTQRERLTHLHLKDAVALDLMTRCDGHIVSKAPLSFWGAYLADGAKRVVAPDSLFRPPVRQEAGEGQSLSHWHFIPEWGSVPGCAGAEVDVGVLVVATGRYLQLVAPLLQSLREHFLPTQRRCFYVFTDHAELAPDSEDVVVVPIRRRGFPGDSMYRYHHYLTAEELLRRHDVLYAMDADMRAVADIFAEDVLPTKDRPLLGVAHPGFAYSREPLGTPETDPRSRAYIATDEVRSVYWAGGIVGGWANAFLELCRQVRGAVDADAARGVVALWHDESHLNRILTTRRRDVRTVSPSLCTPEGDVLPSPPRLLALNKEHSAMRAAAPGVSVLLPLYNGIEFLEEAVESLLKQTYPFWHLNIGVNGHSAGSGVFQRAKRFESDRIEVREYLGTRGAPATLSAMAQDARYDLVTLLDADDVWLPHKLERQVAIKARGWDVVGTLCRYFGEGKGAPSLPRRAVSHARFYRHNPIIHSAAMLDRADAQWRDEFLYDYDLWLRLNTQGRLFYNIPEVLALHRVHGASRFNSSPQSAAERWPLVRRHWPGLLPLVRSSVRTRMRQLQLRRHRAP